MSLLTIVGFLMVNVNTFGNTLRHLIRLKFGTLIDLVITHLFAINDFHVKCKISVTDRG